MTFLYISDIGSRGKRILYTILTAMIVIMVVSCSEYDPNEFDAPKDLSIDRVADGKVRLTWDYDTNGKTVVYVIARQQGEGNWNESYYTTTNSDRVFVDDIQTDSYEVFAYKVKAYYEDEESFSAFSEPVAWFSPQTAPTDLTIVQTGESTVELTWKDNAVGEMGYKIDKKTGNHGWVSEYKKLFDNSESTVDSVEFAVPVQYRVYAYFGSAKSAVLEEQLDPSFPAPDSLLLTQLSQSQVRVRWSITSQGQDGFAVERRLGNGQFAHIANVTSGDEYIDYLSVPSGQLDYRVRAYASITVDGQASMLYSAFSQIKSIFFNIKRIGSLDLQPRGNDLVIKDRYAYIANDYNGLQVIDISNESAPSAESAWIITGRTMAIDEFNGYIFVSNYPGGIHCVDFSEMTQPVEYTNYYCATNGIPYDFAISNTGFVFVADGGANLTVIRLADAQFNSMQVARYNTPGVSFAVELEGTTLYMADGEDGVKMFDISDPYNPQLLDESGFIGEARDIALTPTEIFVAAGESGLVVLDKNTLEVRRSLDTPGFARNIGLNSNYVYVTDNENGLVIMDALFPLTPSINAVYPAESEANVLFLRDSFLFLVTEHAFEVIQVIP